MTARQELARATGVLQAHGVADARLDAEVLLAHVLKVERTELYREPERRLSPAARARYQMLAERRARERWPVAYLTGTREFWSLPFAVNPQVLIPRPETETLVAAVLRLAERRMPRTVLEIGVGSGAITGALAHELPRTRFVAVDCSRAALRAARQNLERLGVEARVGLLLGDLAGGLRGSFDLVVSNPPYVPSAQLRWLAPELRREPALGLDGGRDGLACLRRIVAQAPPLLRRPGWLLLEIGSGQAAAVTEALWAQGAADVTSQRDLAGVERVLIARFAEA